MSGGHANCDRCGADLLGASVRYVARFELKQGYDAMEVSPQDLRRDLKGELRAVLRELEGLSDAEVREAEDATALAVYWDLCAACAKDVRAGMKREKGNLRHMNIFRLLLLAGIGLAWAAAAGEAGPEVPRIDSVDLLAPQPWKGDAATIWYDDFDGAEATQAQYHEYDHRSKDNVRAEDEFLGAGGKSLRIYYAKGSKGAGGRKLCFGDCPFGPPLRKGEKFEELWWRIYVKHQYGWTGGGPAKMSRCTSFASGNWTQAMIGHVWSSGEALTLDPASGVKEGKVVTTKYNDFPNLKWLGNKPASPFKLHATSESGRWVCVEARTKLNTPGQKDGAMQLWIDGLMQCDRKNLDFRGTWTERGINAIFLEAYWNEGSPVEQCRWYDDFAVSTKPLGPLVAPPNPVLRKTPFRGAEGSKQGAWEAQLAERVEGAGDGAEAIFKRLPDEWGHQAGEDAWVRPVWASKPVAGAGLTVTADAAHGAFSGSLQGAEQLAPGKTYFCRCRQQDERGRWSEWSPWHQAFQTSK